MYLGQDMTMQETIADIERSAQQVLQQDQSRNLDYGLWEQAIDTAGDIGQSIIGAVSQAQSQKRALGTQTQPQIVQAGISPGLMLAIGIPATLLAVALFRR